MRNNFKNPKTNKEFSIGRVKSAYNKDKKCMMYFDLNGDPLIDEDGTLLVPIENEGNIEVSAIRTPTKNR